MVIYKLLSSNAVYSIYDHKTTEKCKERIAKENDEKKNAIVNKNVEWNKKCIHVIRLNLNLI